MNVLIAGMHKANKLFTFKINKMRITKFAAEGVATKLVEKRQKEYDKKVKAFCQKIKDLYNAQVPDEVKTCFKKHSEYFRVSNSLNFENNNGWGYQNFNFVGTVIIKQNDGYNFNADKETLSLLKTEWNKLEDEKEAIALLQRDTLNALLGLQTYARIEKELPEAFPFLPAANKMALALNFPDLRKRLATV